VSVRLHVHINVYMSICVSEYVCVCGVSCTHLCMYVLMCDRLCDLVVRVSGYRYRGPGIDSRRYQIFWVVVGLERSQLNLVRSIEELLGWKTRGSRSRKQRLKAVGPVALTRWHPSICKSRYELQWQAAASLSIEFACGRRLRSLVFMC